MTIICRLSKVHFFHQNVNLGSYLPPGAHWVLEGRAGAGDWAEAKTKGREKEGRELVL